MNLLQYQRLSGNALDNPHTPQWAASVQDFLVDLERHLDPVIQATTRRQFPFEDVLGEIEVRIVHPLGVGEIHGHERELLP